MKANISGLITAMALLMTTMSVFASVNESANVKVFGQYRSGNPEATLTEEVYYNSVTFSPITGVESYNINRDGSTIAVLKQSGEGEYAVMTADANGNFTVNAGSLKTQDGEVSYVDAVSDYSVRPGEGSLVGVDGEMVIYGYNVTAEGESRAIDGQEYRVLYTGITAELAIAMDITDIKYMANAMNVSLQWIDVAKSEGTTYQIYRNDGTGWELAGETTEQSYTDSYQGPSNAVVSYYIKADGDTSEYNSQVLAVDYVAQQNGVITGIEDINADESGLTINVYPNPATDYVTVEGAQSNITLFGMNGAAALSMPVVEGETVTLDVTGLTKGLYVLRSGNNSSVKILIK